MRRIELIGLIGAVLLLAACSADTECRQSSAIYMTVEFSGDSLRQSTDSARLSKDSLAMDTIRFSTVTGMQIRGVGRDSIIYDSTATFTKAYLPLRPDTTITAFEFIYQGRTDTLRLYHQNDMQFISLACGCFVFHTLDRFASNRTVVDSCDIVNAGVTTAAETNLKIFYHKR